MDEKDLDRLVEGWLATKSARSRSPHTLRNYVSAMQRWQRFLSAHEPPAHLLEVEASHVRAWQQQMRERGLSEQTVNHQLSCVSSFYGWLANEKRLLQGAETHIFRDAAGRPRSNPFRGRNVPRGRTVAYERARILSQDEVERLLVWLELNAGTVAGARNRALLLTFLFTGWRPAELLRMRWGDLRPSRAQPGVMLYTLRGRGDKRVDDVLPAECYRSICAYLEMAGRLGNGVSPLRDDPVWLPVREPRMDQLRHAPHCDAQRPLSEKSALRILRTALRGAGVNTWETYRIPDLRHTHAHLLLESGQSLAMVQHRLHHVSLATTGLYVRTVHGREPVDVVTAAFAQLGLGK